jgi:hypothetical protein
MAHPAEPTVAAPPAKGHLETHVEEDVIVVTTKRPYREINFLMTYIAAGLGALASFGGFVMPATSLALINEDLGTKATNSEIVHGELTMSHTQDHQRLLHGWHWLGHCASRLATPW